MDLPIVCQYVYTFTISGARWWWVINASPRLLYPLEKGRGMNYRGRVGAGRAWRRETLLTTPGFGSRLVQPLASRLYRLR